MKKENLEALSIAVLLVVFIGLPLAIFTFTAGNADMLSLFYMYCGCAVYFLFCIDLYREIYNKVFN